MKNNILKKKLLITLFVLFSSFAFAEEEFTFESSIIEYKDDENLIIAKGNVKVTSSNGLEIFSNESRYFKLTNKLLLSGEVKIIDKSQNIEIKSNNVVYDKNNELIKSIDKTLIEINGYLIQTSDLEYLRAILIILTKV